MNKITMRARRLEKALSTLGWETGIDSMVCSNKKCGRQIGYAEQYCCACGTKAPAKFTLNKSVLLNLENAIAYALGERK